MIGFIGGTGPEGKGLALRFAMAGERVAIGSRDGGRAQEAAESLSDHARSASISGALNQEVARTAEVVFVTVPYAAQRETLEAVTEQLAGKIVVDVVAPLAYSKGVTKAMLVAEGSAALEAQAVLPASIVVAAFQTISAQDLLIPNRTIDSDVVVCADDSRARDQVMKLAEEIEGVRAVNGGGLQNAFYVENIAALLLNINRIYKARSAIKIMGI